MKIIQGTSYFYPHVGGVETHVIELSQSLIEMGHDVTVLCADVPRSKTYEVLDGLTILRFPALDLPYLPYMYFLKRAIHKLDADIVHSHYPPPFMSNALVSALTKVPHVLTYHCDVVIPERLANLIIPQSMKRLVEHANKKLFLETILHRVNRIIATTNSYARTSDILKNLHYDVVPNGIKLERYDEALRQLRAERDESTILYVGRLTSVKGVDYLIKAAKIVTSEFPNTKFLIVGRGEEERNLHRLAKGYENTIKFLGHVSWSDLIKLYRTCTLLALPSFTRLEAFGIVLLEAMACEIPIVASNIPGVSDVVSDAGLLVEPKNPMKLANVIIELLTNSHQAKALGTNGRKLVENKYDWKVVTTQILEIYRDTSNKFDF